MVRRQNKQILENENKMGIYHYANCLNGRARYFQFQNQTEN